MKQYENTLGQAIFDELENNAYLKEIYENILYNYGARLFANSQDELVIDMPIEIEDALRFADLLSNSTHPTKSDAHKIMAQEMVALLYEMYGNDTRTYYYLYEKYGRDPATRKRYGRAWKRIRDSYVKQHPFCELCYEKGVLVEVEEVHHKIPLSEGGTHDRENLISLCKSCHARIHAERGDRWHGRKSDSYE